ncbi:glycosyltransferase [Alteromonas aestuariivivens]|uniref:Glycosyltransferase n=1 Tax=Alteromonas aestuariivivens TaxID=1938339 RepID=A0A3D8M601_9ALTE|nr:glycosyltransferase [Alteromonas aestuariivivens]RDV25051.1 glycosyltransferase [Alteromonas aestuariivivens]
MKLSVLIPAFKLEKYIAACVTSVCEQQTSFDFEVLVCDDASPDGTADIIRNLARCYPQLIPIFKTENRGLAANMSTLLSRAKGDYIAYLDGDDIALPGKLQKQVMHLDTNPDCGMVFHESDVFDSDTNKSVKLYSQGHYNWARIPARSDITHLVRFGTYMQASSVMFRRHPNLCDAVVPECEIILDYPFYVMNAGFLNGKIDFIEDVLGRYRIHNESFGAQTQKSVSRRLQSLNDILLTCRKAGQFGVEQDVIEQGIEHHIYAAALYFLFRNHDQQFTVLIEQSAPNGRFFDQQHKEVWLNRTQPAQVRELLAS